MILTLRILNIYYLFRKIDGQDLSICDPSSIRSSPIYCELAEQHFHHLTTTSPTFIESVLDGRNTVFSEQQSNERLVNGLKEFLSTLS